MKKVISIVVAIMLLVCAFAFAEDVEGVELGTSGLFVILPEDYELGEITEDDTDESQVAYYYSEDSLLDFDVYQWAKAEGETLEGYAAEEAAEYGAEAEMTEINGVPCAYYIADEEYDGVEYQTANYIFENGDFFAEIVFWLDGENADEEAESIVNTIAALESAELSDEGTEITLGTSDLDIVLPALFVAGEITEEDTDEGQVAYYYSEECPIDFDVYQWTKAEGETLESYAAEEAALYDAEPEALQIGDLKVMAYYALEEYDDSEYATITYITEDGDDFVEIVFWLDGENPEDVVEAIIETLA